MTLCMRRRFTAMWAAGADLAGVAQDSPEAGGLRLADGGARSSGRIGHGAQRLPARHVAYDVPVAARADVPRGSNDKHLLVRPASHSRQFAHAPAVAARAPTKPQAWSIRA